MAHWLCFLAHNRGGCMSQGVWILAVRASEVHVRQPPYFKSR